MNKSLLEQLHWVVTPSVPPPAPPKDDEDDDDGDRKVFDALHNPFWLLDNNMRKKLITVNEICNSSGQSAARVERVFGYVKAGCPRQRWMFQE